MNESGPAAGFLQMWSIMRGWTIKRTIRPWLRFQFGRLWARGRQQRHVIQLDKYARDARAWRDFAKVDYKASGALFASGNPFLYFTAATLAHHALEMYLKAALISEGMTAFDPGKIKLLDPAVGLQKKDCAWGHNLAKLARELSRRRADFDLSALMNIPGCLVHEMPMTPQTGFELFDPFFSELRYPQELKKLEGVGAEEKIVLDELVRRLQLFLARIG